jgi:hypothetical protein
MITAPAVPFIKRAGKRRPAPSDVRRRSPGVRESESAQRIEIVAPDRYSTAVLLEFAAPIFSAEIIAGPGWIVSLQTPAGGAWVGDLLALVERWLDYVGLPCAKALYGGRSYLIPASTDIAHLRRLRASHRAFPA